MVRYKKEDIDKLIKFMDKLTVSGLTNASILVQMFNILNNPIPDEQKKGGNENGNFETGKETA